MRKTFSLALVLILAVSSLSLLMVKPASAQSSSVIIVTTTPTPMPTQAPTPTPTRNIALDYNEVSRASDDVDTISGFSCKCHIHLWRTCYDKLSEIFVLNILLFEGGGPAARSTRIMIYTGYAKPVETGSVTIDSENQGSRF